MILSGSSLVLPCSLQRVSLIPSPLLLLLGEEWISWPLVFLPTFLSLCRSHSLTLGLYRMLPYLPSYLSPTCLLILSRLPCFSSIWDGEDSFSPLSFPSFLAPVVTVFPSAFFTSLLIPDVLAFGTQDSPCLPYVPICVLIQPVFSYLLFCLGFRTFRCFGAINITESLICVPSVAALLQSPLFISFCPSLLLFFFLGASGHRILFVVLDGKGFFLPPICFHTCLLVCSQLVSLLLYLHCDSSLWVLSVKGISLSPVPHFSLHCSVCFVLVALGAGLKSHLFSYSSLYFTLTCGCSLWVLPGHSMLLVLCLSPRLSPLFSPTRALTSLSPSLPLSLSLAVLLSRCLFAHMMLSGSSLVLPCSLQRVSLIPSPLLLLLGEEWISWPLAFLPTFLPLCRSHSLTLGLYRMLPYLPPYLSPTCLLILSPLPSFSSIWDGEDSFSPLSFPSFLAPVGIVFPSAFFTSLLIPDVLAFGTQDSPCLPCVPICVLIQPVFSYMLFCVGSHQCPY